MKVTVERFDGRTEEFTVPSPQEIQAFKDALQPIVEFFTQDPPAPSFASEDGFIEEMPPSSEPEPGEAGSGKVGKPEDEYFVAEPESVGTVLTDRPKCFLCENVIEGDDSYCYGCRVFVCTEHPQTPWGRHEPEAHDEP